MMRRRTIGAFWRTFGPYLTEIIASVLKLTSDMRMIVSLVNYYLTIPNGAKANGFFLPPTPPHMCAVQSSQGSLWNIIFQLSPKTMLIMMSS